MEETEKSKFQIDISNFKKGQKLNKDGFGSCYSSQNKETGESYAIKVIENGFYDDDQQRKIEKEMDKIFSLKHPTMVKFYGYSFKSFHDEKRLTVVMKIAKNGSLSELITKARHSQTDKDIDNTIKQIILIGIARGMMFLHHHHIIHRFLRMENVLLDENFHPHLTEFYLSKIFDATKIKEMFKKVETWFYVAPEIISNQKFNGKSDVFSFGIIMYEVLTELIPYPLFLKGKLSIDEFCQKVVNENYRPAFDVPVKEPFKKLITDCWSKNPDDRPTFDEIFKKLAYQFEDSIYSNEESDQLYCLDNIDNDVVRNYVDEITDNIYSARLEKLEEKTDKLEQANHDLKIKNKQLKKVNDQMNLRISHLENMLNERILEKQQSKEQNQQQQDEQQNQQQNDIDSVENNTTTPDEIEHESQAMKLLHEKGITVNYFNALPLHSQQTVIEDIVTNSANGHLNNFFRKLNELLLFILPTDPSETASSCIEIHPVNEDTDHINILSPATKMLYRHQLLHSENLIKLLKEFKDISIELKYPSKSFKKAYSQLSKIKSNEISDLQITVFFSGVKKTDLTFSNNKKITSVKIDWSVTSIFGGSLGGSFSGCTSLVKVIIPPSVTSIGDCAFEGCTKLATLDLPSSVTSIGYRAFDGCSALLELSLPPSVKTIGWRAFYDCNSLSKITVPSAASVGEEAFPKTTKVVRYLPKHGNQ